MLQHIKLQKFDNIKDKVPLSFSLLEPKEQLVPFIFNSPHSGKYYPQSFIESSLLDSHTIRQSEDFMVDELFASVIGSGMPLIRANYARAYLDVNREPYELDPGMFADKLPITANTASIRVAGGLGTVARIVADHQEIYRDKLDVSEVMALIEHMYQRFRAALNKLLARIHSVVGYALLVVWLFLP